MGRVPRYTCVCARNEVNRIDLIRLTKFPVANIISGGPRARTEAVTRVMRLIIGYPKWIYDAGIFPVIVPYWTKALYISLLYEQFL
jgi:hypothetical protein